MSSLVGHFNCDPIHSGNVHQLAVFDALDDLADRLWEEQESQDFELNLLPPPTAKRLFREYRTNQ